VNLALRIGSIVVTLALIVVAGAIGAGVPIAPARIADATTDAAHNVAIAEGNTEKAVQETEDLAQISKNVRKQLETSRRMLSTQLEIERATGKAAASSQDLNDALTEVGNALGGVESQLSDLLSLAHRSAATVDATVSSATDLQEVIALLQARFQQVTEQSRELNRKARSYAEAKDGPDD
jgi:chromosome segregation ATPase